MVPRTTPSQRRIMERSNTSLMSLQVVPVYLKLLDDLRRVLEPKLPKRRNTEKAVSGDAAPAPKKRKRATDEKDDDAPAPKKQKKEDDGPKPKRSNCEYGKIEEHKIKMAAALALDVTDEALKAVKERMLAVAEPQQSLTQRRNLRQCSRCHVWCCIQCLPKNTPECGTCLLSVH